MPRISGKLEDHNDSGFKLLDAQDIDIKNGAVNMNAAPTDTDIFIVDDNGAGTQASTKYVSALHMKTYFTDSIDTTPANVDLSGSDTDTGGNHYLLFADGITGSEALQTDADLRYDAVNKSLSVAEFDGNLTGNAETVTNGVYTNAGTNTLTGNLAMANNKTLTVSNISSDTADLSIQGNADVSIMIDHDGGSAANDSKFIVKNVSHNCLTINELGENRFFGSNHKDAEIHLASSNHEEYIDNWRIMSHHGTDTDTSDHDFTISHQSGEFSWNEYFKIKADDGAITGNFSASSVTVTGQSDGATYYPVLSTGTGTGQSLYAENATTSNSTVDLRYKDHILYCENLTVEGTLVAAGFTAGTATNAEKLDLDDWGSTGGDFFVPFFAQTTDYGQALTDSSFTWDATNQELTVGGKTDGTGNTTILGLASTGSSNGSTFKIKSSAKGGSGTNDGSMEFYTGSTKRFSLDGSNGLAKVEASLTVVDYINVQGVAGGAGSTFTGDVTVGGNLTVSGTTTTVNTTNLTIADKNIVLASGSSGAVTSDGAGITVEATAATNGDPSIQWKNIGSNTDFTGEWYLSKLGQDNTALTMPIAVTGVSAGSPGTITGQYGGMFAYDMSNGEMYFYDHT